MKETLHIVRSIAAGVVLWAGIFLGLSWSWWIAGLMGIGGYFAVYYLTKPVVRIGDIDIASLTNGEELRQLMQEGYEDLSRIDIAQRNAENPQIRENAAELYQTGVQIFEHLQRNPDKIRIARRFLTYYLDTAAEIFTKYMKLQQTGLRTKEALDVQEQTVRATEVLNRAFQNQFAKLMQNELMDIETDIKVLEQTLKMEEIQ